MSTRWYAARTGPLKEYAVRDHLAAAGFRVFLPCVTSTRPRRGRWDEPLFPGYLFIRYDLESLGSRAPAQISPSVRLVRLGGVAPPLPEPVIDELVERVSKMTARGGLWRRYEVGEPVSVTIGRSETMGEVVEANESSTARVRVLLSLLGRMADAWVPVERLRGASGAHPARRTRGRGRSIRGFGPSYQGPVSVDSHAPLRDAPGVMAPEQRPASSS